MEERRQFVRLDTRLDITYTVLPQAQARKTVTKNISAGGICLITHESLTIGQHLQLAVKLPQRPEPVHCLGEVVWSEPYEVIGRTERTRAAEVGVRFLEIAPADREAVMQHVILSFQPQRGRS